MRTELTDILRAVKAGEITIEDAALKLKMEPYNDLGYAKVDMHRKLRQGVAEVIYGAGKNADQIIGIAKSMMGRGLETVLITRMDSDKASAVAKEIQLEYYEDAGIGIVGALPVPNGLGKVLVITGGTSDIPVAEEAALTAQALGNEVIRAYDVGVAGLHRLLDYMEDIMSASVIVAIAGMEGALASVVGGLADCPVIAVPTSVGYGAAFEGLSALLSMLNSCASGVSVVNIDNGFGAGYMASLINHMK